MFPASANNMHAAVQHFNFFFLRCSIFLRALRQAYDMASFFVLIT